MWQFKAVKFSLDYGRTHWHQHQPWSHILVSSIALITTMLKHNPRLMHKYHFTFIHTLMPLTVHFICLLRLPLKWTPLKTAVHWTYQHGPRPRWHVPVFDRPEADRTGECTTWKFKNISGSNRLSNDKYAVSKQSCMHSDLQRIGGTLRSTLVARTSEIIYCMASQCIIWILYKWPWSTC